MQVYQIVIIIGAVIILGLIKIFSRIRSLNKKYIFAHKYLKSFNNLVTSKNSKNEYLENYTWLTKNVNKIQDELGIDGIVLNYKPPGATYMFSNYQLIINTLPEIINKKVHPHMVQACIDSLVRYLGRIEHSLNQLSGHLRNPLIWVREGIKFIVTFPLLLGYWFGLYSQESFLKIDDSKFISFISFLCALIGLIGSIITIALGWEKFISIF